MNTNMTDRERYAGSFSHLRRYLWLPLIVLGAAIVNNFAASYIQVLIGQAFDLIVEPDWETAVLLAIAVAVFWRIAVQSILGLMPATTPTNSSPNSFERNSPR
jgi:hypothetical protein